MKLRDALGETFPTPRPAELTAKVRLRTNSRACTASRAALEGKLDREPLLAQDTNEAYTQLQELPGSARSTPV